MLRRNTFTRALTHYIDLKPANKHNMHEEKWKRPGDFWEKDSKD